MPDWQKIDEAFAHLVRVRAAFDEGLRVVIANRNAGALPVLEILAAECDKVIAEVLAEFGPSPAVDSGFNDGPGYGA
jgi:hypothetical protein